VIDECSRWRLAEDTGGSHQGDGQPDASGIPSPARGQTNRHERPEPLANISQDEEKGIERQ
jgi:hypothetical protein